MEQYLKLIDQKIKDLEVILNRQIEYDCQEEIVRIEAKIQQWKNIKTMLLAWQATYDNTFGDDYRYEINIYKSDKNYALFDEAFKLTDKIMSGGK